MENATTCLFTSFAIYVTTMIGRMQSHLSLKNYDISFALGEALWAIGIYVILLRFRYFKTGRESISWLLIIGSAFCTLLHFAGYVLNASLNLWLIIPPFSCDAPIEENTRPYVIISWIVLGLTILSIALIALPPLKHQLMLLFRCSVGLICVSGLACIATIESSIYNIKGDDEYYAPQASVWTLGQIIAIMMVGLQIIGLIKYLRELEIPGETRFSIWRKYILRKFGRLNKQEDSYLLVETHLKSEKGIL